ncbi:hypothetical protein B0H14DRAFT_2623281 [Mycena olivaceomarginata]|nr:hypothetical protein B0H14DRAFT_2623281 [Mycena olivaceomarginata]
MWHIVQPRFLIILLDPLKISLYKSRAACRAVSPTKACSVPSGHQQGARGARHEGGVDEYADVFEVAMATNIKQPLDGRAAVLDLDAREDVGGTDVPHFVDQVVERFNGLWNRHVLVATDATSIWVVPSLSREPLTCLNGVPRERPPWFTHSSLFISCQPLITDGSLCARMNLALVMITKLCCGILHYERLRPFGTKDQVIDSSTCLKVLSVTAMGDGVFHSDGSPSYAVSL